MKIAGNVRSLSCFYENREDLRGSIIKLVLVSLKMRCIPNSLGRERYQFEEIIKMAIRTSISLTLS
jgi:hypothetical protein